MCPKRLFKYVVLKYE